jgi:hypothetical protein
LQFCSSDESPIPDCKAQNAVWHVFCFCNLQLCKSMNPPGLSPPGGIYLIEFGASTLLFFFSKKGGFRIS